MDAFRNLQYAYDAYRSYLRFEKASGSMSPKSYGELLAKKRRKKKGVSNGRFHKNSM